MNVTCQECETVYRVDPAKVPAGGVQARCDRCEAVVFIAAPSAEASGDFGDAGNAESHVPEREVAAPPSFDEPYAEPQGFQPVVAGMASDFGKADPDTRAKRLATALISDIKAYYPDRWKEGMERGSVREDLREEIRKSWDEYTLQVGDAMARNTSYFRDALNQILGEGRRLF